ncbi:aryl-alcohol dehydrogenase [Crepidotus variabilis]|uniref:Aryl-alcohol dehydrogenase n=1 Tax=Crepidotus variabilis TaxID=179855 RepID=A0A9P6JNI0_9AGAR|nr:aryl-alcohol dehydrogenase [Crepidotus variabilis]
MSVPSSKKVGYVRLGNSGLKVSKIILGTMQYGSAEWQPWTIGEEEAIKQIKAAYDVGIQTFDTADAYSNGLSEIILGKAIKQLELPRDEIVIMTKVFNIVAPDYGLNLLKNKPAPDAPVYVNQRGLSRKHIFQAVKRSLERLQLEYIDVLQCHRFDTQTPIEETMQALHDIVQAGHARYIGMSSCHAWQCYAINNKLTPFILMQNHYNLIYREEEREMFPTLKHLGVGCIPWSPLAGGLLAKPLDQSSPRRDTYWIVNQYLSADGTAPIIARVEQVAKKLGISMGQVAMAWVLSKEGVIAPIVGTTSLENLEELIAAVDVASTSEEISYLEEPYKPQAIIGHS